MDQLGLSESLDAKALAGSILRVLLSLGTRIGLAYATAGGSEFAKAAFGKLKPEEFAQHFSEHAHYQDEVKATKERFAKLIGLGIKKYKDTDTSKVSPSERRVAIFIDDVDRCLPENVVMLIEGIKLLLAGEGITPQSVNAGDGSNKAVFVFGLDRQIVGEAIRARYPNSTLYTGENYLEKIFDVSLEVPPASKEGVRKLIYDSLKDQDRVARLVTPLGNSNEDDSKPLVDVLCNPVFANPRVIKRVLNRLDLLFSDEERKRRVSSMRDEDLATRFVAWVAGTERFRTFRHFYFGATEVEIAGLRRGIEGIDGPVVSPTVTRILETPGFLAYARLILGTKPADRLQPERKPSINNALTTLRDFDDLLRSAGL